MLWGKAAMGGRLLWTITIGIFSFSAVAGEVYDTSGMYAGSYLCIADASGGVAYEVPTGRWVGAVFNVDDSRFVLKVEPLAIDTVKFLGAPEKAQSYRVAVAPFGGAARVCHSQTVDLTSIDDKNEPTYMWAGGSFVCTSVLSEYRFNLSKLRFSKIYSIGYVNGEDNRENTPSIQIGRCTKI